MKLLYTLTTYPPAIGGAQLHQHFIAQELQKQHQVQVITHWNQNRTDWLLGTTIKAPEISQDYIIDGIKVHKIGINYQDKLKLAPFIPIYYPFMDVALPKISQTLQKYLDSYAQKTDIIHNVRIGREGLSYASYQIARKKNLPFVFTPVHHPRWIGWRYRAYIKLYQMADMVITLTNAEKQILITLGVKENKIKVTGHAPILANNADPDNFKQKYQLKNAPIVLFLGQHYAYKGYQQLLEATSQVWQKIPETQFIFVGPAIKNSETYFSNITDKRIHRLGAVDLQEKTNAIAACDVLCVPSTQESFGGVYTEAWSFNKPIIGCNIPAVAEVVTHGVDGLLISQDSYAIADSICELLLDEKQAKIMGEAGKKKVELKYNWPYLASLTSKIYQNLLSI